MKSLFGAPLVGLGALVILMAGLARAQEHTDYHDVYNNILGTIGFGKDREAVDYSPRAPIVVPPTNTLPQPLDTKPAHPAGFPQDPDVTARRQALVDPRRPVQPGESGTRAYLIDPPAAYFDAAAVAATGNNADRGEAAGEAPKKARHRKAQPATPE